MGKDRRLIAPFTPVATALNLRMKPGDSVELWAFSGAWNQLQILPPSSELSKIRDSYGSASKLTTPWDAMQDDKTMTRRKLDNFFRVTFRSRRQTASFRLTVPFEVIDLDLLRIDEALVLEIADQGVELWRRDRWTDATRVGDVDSFIEDANDLLEGD
jgi:hypothetical protein